MQGYIEIGKCGHSVTGEFPAPRWVLIGNCMVSYQHIPNSANSLIIQMRLPNQSRQNAHGKLNFIYLKTFFVIW